MARYLLFLLVIVLLPVREGVAEASFDLFSPDRGKAPPAAVAEGDQPTPDPVVSRPPKAKKSAEKFALRGTSRIGGRYVAVLQPSRGKQLAIRWTPGETTGIDGYEGYRLSEVSPRMVRILYPPDERCIDDPAGHLICNAKGDSATISLAFEAPTSPKSPPAEGSGKDRGGQEKKVINPFQAALERAKEKASRGDDEGDGQALTPQQEQMRKARAERFKNFKPKQIDPDEVPSGMKVVHTPFGDRLVPEK